jgi:hypothetical protein
MTELELELEERATPAVWVVSIEVAGVPVDLDRVFSSLSVRHGRDDIDGPIQATTATLILREIDRGELDRFEPGFDVLIESTFTATNGRPLFLGVITDATLVDEDPDEPRLELIATGPLAIAGRRSVAGHAWPAEPWAARAARILTEAELAGVVQAPVPDVAIAATVPTDPETGYFETMSALDALELSRQDVGATVFDDAGRIVVQAFDARRELFPVLTVDPALVLYAPAWSKTLDVANRIVLGFGYGAGTVTVDDPVSQDTFGIRWTGLFDSGLADQPTAHDRALTWLDRVSWPRWKLPNVVLLEPLDLSIGQMLELSELPPAAPFPSWAPVVEGWTDSIDGDAWTQSVVVSDPVLSGLGLAWEDVTPTLQWQGVDPACAWRDAYILSNLEP